MTNLLSQLVCVRGVNRLTSVRHSFLCFLIARVFAVPRSLQSIILPSTSHLPNILFTLTDYPTASLLRLDEPRPNDPQSAQPLLLRLVVRERVECAAGGGRGDGVRGRPVVWMGE